MQNQENAKLLDHFEDNDQEEEEVEEEDSLSFSNLPLGNADDSSVQQSPRLSVSSPLSDEPFEFFNCLSPGNSQKICAHVSSSQQISNKKEEAEVEAINNDNKKGGYLAMFRSVSFGKRRSKTCHSDQYMKKHDETFRYITKERSSSARIDQQVNITALTSMSAKSRRRMFMFGPVKFKPEMELSAIKQRRAKRAPSMMLPRPGGGGDGGGDTAASGGERKGKGGGDSRQQWGLVRSRANLTALLARSFGCIPMGGVDRLISVAN